MAGAAALTKKTVQTGLRSAGRGNWAGRSAPAWCRRAAAHLNLAGWRQPPDILRQAVFDRVDERDKFAAELEGVALTGLALGNGALGTRRRSAYQYSTGDQQSEVRSA